MSNPSEKDKNVVSDAAKSSSNLMEDKCGLYESSRTDSGFLSSANLTTSSDQLLSEEIRCTTDSGLVEEEPYKEDKSFMRLDSGVDVCLSETFSNLSLNLKNPSLNNLNATKTRTNEEICQNNKNIEQEQHPWELYYKQDEDGDTQLHIAIIHGFLEVVYSLIRLAPHPCLLDILNDYSQTPLHLAVLSRQPRIVRRLVAAGARPQMRDLRGNTPLHLACAQGDLECARALTETVSMEEIEALGLNYQPSNRVEIDLEQRNYDGEMCVHLAALGGHVDVLRHLVWFGANINAREGKSGYTPLHMALERGDQTTVHFLLQECLGLQLECPTYAGRTPIQLATSQPLLQALRARGAQLPPDSEDDSEYDSDSTDEMSYEQSSNLYKPGLVINASA